MHQAQCGDTTGILQIQKVFTYLVCEQQAFVDDGAGRHAGHVVLATVRQLQALNVRTAGFANDVQLALKRILNNDIVTTPDENLAHDWLFFTHGG